MVQSATLLLQAFETIVWFAIVPVAFKVILLPVHTAVSLPAFGVPGTALIVNCEVLVPVAVAVETDINPVVAVTGKLTTTIVALVEVGTAVTPLNETEVTPAKLVPVRVTTTGVVPEQTLVGVKLVMLGTITHVIFASQPDLTTVPSEVNLKVSSPPAAVE